MQEQYFSDIDRLNTISLQRGIAPYRLIYLQDGKIADINDSLKDLNIKELGVTINKGILLFKYRDINRAQMVLLWFNSNPQQINIENIRYIMNIVPELSIKDIEDLRQRMKLEDVSVDKRLKMIEIYNRSFIEHLKKLPEVPEKNIPIFIEEIEWNLLIQLPRGSFLELFNRLKVSNDIPLIVLYYENRRLFKVNIKQYKFDIERETIKNNAITLYIRLAGKITQVSITEDGRVEVRIPASLSPNTITKYISNSLEESISVIFSEQRQIWCKFAIDDEIDIPVLFDTIVTDKVLIFFNFLDEIKKTSLAKDRSYIYYLPGHILDPTTSYSITDAVTVLFTPVEHKRIDVRISRASSESQARTSLNVIRRIIKYSLNRSAQIREEYKKVIGSKLPPPMLIKREQKEQKDMGRAQILKLKRPQRFGIGFTSTCQKDHQPILIEGESNTKEYIKEKLNGDQHKIINFPKESEDYYVCYPREEDDKNKSNIWPGLAARGWKAGLDESFMYPCCFKSNQYDKKKSLWNLYNIDQSKEIEITKRDIQYILGPAKNALPFRRAELPSNIKTLFPKSYRMGTIISPQSILYILALYIDSSFISYSEEKRIEFIEKLYDDIFIDEYDRDMYIDPLQSITRIQTVLNINILPFTLDNNGEFLYPKSDLAYIPQDLIFDTTIVIVLVEPNVPQELKYQYQCEILEMNGKYKFKTEEIKDIIDMWKKGNAVYMLGRDGSKEIRTYDSEGVGVQYVDTFNKLRAITLYGNTVLTDPSAPIQSIPVVKDITTFPIIDIDDVKKLKILGKMAGLDKNTVKGVKTDMGIVPITGGVKPDIPLSEPLTSFLINNKNKVTSKLKTLRYQRRVAEILQELSVYQTRLNGDISATFKPRHIYDLKTFSYRFNTIDPVFWEDNLLIIPDIETADRLRLYVKEYIYSNGKIIPQKEILSSAFSRQNDFDIRQNESLFTSYEDLIKGWKIEKIENLKILSYIPKDNNRDPSIFIHPVWTDGVICLVQKVKNNSIDRASTLSRGWFNNRVNSGYDTQPKEPVGDIQILDFTALIDITKPTIVATNDGYASLLPLNQSK